MRLFIGNAVGAKFGHFSNFNLSIELLYSAIVIALCLLIYYKTKEIYDLTSHKGIKYFRLAFLFFALTYFFRFTTNIIMFTHRLFDFEIRRGFIHYISMPFLAYASSIAILYLMLSTVHKKFKGKHTTIFVHVLAVAIVTMIFVTGSPIIMFVSQLILFLFAIIMSYLNRKKMFSKLFIIYVLLFLFWVLNLLADAARFFHWSRLPLTIASVAVFSLIAYKVIKHLK